MGAAVPTSHDGRKAQEAAMAHHDQYLDAAADLCQQFRDAGATGLPKWEPAREMVAAATNKEAPWPVRAYRFCCPVCPVCFG